MKVAILGGGISGLICGSLLKQTGIDFKVFERQPYYGGLARSFIWHGFNCDIAAHRIFTRNPETLENLTTLVPMKKHIRQSRIFIGGKWLKDPVDPLELIWKFFPKPGMKFATDYIFRLFANTYNNESFDTYVLSRYGKSLNEFFFRPYTEKLFCIPANEVSVEWAKQKVRGSSFIDMVRRNSKIYFSSFYYPEKGGMGAFSEKFYTEIKDCVLLSTPVVRLHNQGNQINSTTYLNKSKQFQEKFDIFISTIPITELAQILNFPLNLSFRPLNLIYLLINKSRISNNHWVYFGQKDMIVNRLVEFKNFSGNDTPKDRTVLCAEITTDLDSKNLFDKTIGHLHKIGIIDEKDVLDVYHLKEDFAYPLYNLNFIEEVERAKKNISHYHNLHIIGRNAKFKQKEIDEIFHSASKLVEKLKYNPKYF